LLAIMPEVGGFITRYCLKTEEQVLELMRPATQAGLSEKDLLEMGLLSVDPFFKSDSQRTFFATGKAD
jgi:hypothetical protein